ncbi:autotransporter assembly complex protein TamA [Marinobacterium sediminicola]|uniref:Translocation and assembly module subunit TamA n=1 Tax=Marinobacterium sediminicola TaxID=518898 RepID=A0ABY1RWM7_9GAMM|nr:autotransporter assembly complex family protein [Marinobacterium sediminicola]ULG70284.1 autotransporter assembly complex protein TamA [Marinobacterium sediminicola]SMR69856.1 autotransporter secretion outer membrane protein TamA [Marinobacterium sediminicola]
MNFLSPLRKLIVLLLLPISGQLMAAQFVLEGVEGELADNIRALLSIDDLMTAEGSLPTASRLRYLHRQSEAEIRTALQPYGYYRPTLKLLLNIEGEPDQWSAVYRVEAGPQMRINRARLALEGPGETDEVLQQVIDESSIKAGAALLHGEYEALKSRLQSHASERGYYQARFSTNEIRVDVEANLADIELIYETGPRARIGEIRFDAAPVSESLLRRYLPFDSGDPVETAKLVELQRHLINSDYFADVEVRPRLDERAGAELPIDVKLTPRKRSLYQAGFGYGTDTGARMQLGLTRRWLNSRGHTLDTRLRLSEIRQQLSSSYQIPGQNPTTDRFALNFQLEDEQSDTIDARTLRIGGSWQKQLGDWERLLALDWQQETWRFEGLEQDSTLLVPSARFSRTRADNRINTTRGHQISLGVAAAAKTLLSDTDLLQLDLRGKRVDTLSERWRLLTRAELGVTFIDSVDELPASMRFYAGGDNSVRGYDYQSLGPQGDDGDVIGGRYLIAGSVEVDYLIKENWRVAAFVDSGNAFDDTQAELKTGVGLGARWQSPVGPVRLDFAVPLDEDGWQIHFTLGPDL